MCKMNDIYSRIDYMHESEDRDFLVMAILLEEIHTGREKTEKYTNS